MVKTVAAHMATPSVSEAYLNELTWGEFLKLLEV